MVEETKFAVVPMTPNFGAEISGIDLSDRLSKKTLKDLSVLILNTLSEEVKSNICNSEVGNADLGAFPVEIST